MHLKLKSDLIIKKEPHDKMHLKLKSDLIVKKEPHDKMPIKLYTKWLHINVRHLMFKSMPLCSVADVLHA